MTSLALVAGPVKIVLDQPEVVADVVGYEEKIDKDYEKQIIAKFGELMESNESVKKAFKPILDKGYAVAGDSLRDLTAAPITVQTKTNRTMDGEKLRTVVHRTVVIYYAFGGESKNESDIVSSVFAKFKVTGEYSSKDQKLVDHKVMAVFEGFQDTITTEEISAAQKSDSKSE